MEAYEVVFLLICYCTFQHIQTRLKPLDTEPLILQTYYSQQIVIRTIDIKRSNWMYINDIKISNGIIVNQRTDPN
jgi:hypothetical protein